MPKKHASEVVMGKKYQPGKFLRNPDFCAEDSASLNQNCTVNRRIRYLRSFHVDRRVLKVTPPQWLNREPIRDAKTQCDIVQTIERGTEVKASVQVRQ